MSFLNSLKPVLRGQTDITLRVTGGPEGIKIVVTPRLADIKPETGDAELAHLQALLSLPFAITLAADADLDSELARAVSEYHAIREPKLDALDAFRETVKQAEADAAKRKAEADKAKKASGKTTTKASPAAKPEKAAPPPVEPGPDLFSLAASQTPQAATDTPANEPSEAEDDAASDLGSDDTNTTDDNSED